MDDTTNPSMPMDEGSFRKLADDFVRQISENMEQVVYLETLSEHLQLCEASRSPLDVMQSVLPRLCELIRAASVLFLAPAGETDDAGEVAKVVLRAGAQNHFDAAACCRLVRQYRSEAEQQPVIKNRLLGQLDDEGLPGLDSFVLARVAKDDLQVGWLLALNRAPSNPPIINPIWGLSDEEFGTVEAGLMSATAGMLATHASNVRLFREKELMMVEVLQSLMETMDARDSYTCGHSDRVALMARRVAEELGLSREECNIVYLSGLFHDIGKIGVSDVVLRKPALPTAEEYAEIHTHPRHGYDILKHLGCLAATLPGVLHHHERYDGRGYPDGLQGEAIPLAARIIAVADSFDAMSSQRPYRAALAQPTIEYVLQEGSGSQWDPHVVEVFLRLMPELATICANAEARSHAVFLPAAMSAVMTGGGAAAGLDMTPAV